MDKTTSGTLAGKTESINLSQKPEVGNEEVWRSDILSRLRMLLVSNGNLLTLPIRSEQRG